MALSLVTGPAVEPVSLAEIIAHVRPSGHDDDTYLASLIKVARFYCETYLHRQFVTATWRLSLDGFPYNAENVSGDVTGVLRSIIRLPRPPLQSITSIKYIHPTTAVDTPIDAADYTADIYSEPGRLQPAYNKTWPTARLVPNAITVTYKAGYGGATPANDAASVAAVPDPIKHAIKLLVSGWYDNREPANADAVNVTPSFIPFGVDALLASQSYGSYVE